MSGLGERLAAWRFVAAYLRTCWLQRRLRTRADIEAWQEQRIARWRRTVLAQVPFYRELAGVPFGELPVTDKATVMADFAAFNRAGIGAAAGWGGVCGGTGGSGATRWAPAPAQAAIAGCS